MNARAAEIEQRLEEIGNEQARLRAEQSLIHAACLHELLPPRKIGEEYRDICPDCGFCAYCYAM